MFWNTLADGTLLAQTASAQNMLRFGYSQLTVERADPLVAPCMDPSPHMHQIIGGNSLNLTAEPAKYDPAALSTCISCTYSEDFGNYWTASLYFKSPENGTFQRVSQFANVGLQQNGGMTVCYMPYSAKNNKMTAFKPDFRILADDPTPKKPSKASLCHRCLQNGEGFAPCYAKDSAELPTKFCPGGIRATVIFPSCWDGKNLDSPDDKSHVAYSNGGGLGTPNCPSTPPVAIP